MKKDANVLPVSDYHIHTNLCGHARGEVNEYASRAVEIGLKEIGFSDHAPLITHEDPTLSMSLSELPLYHKMIENVRKEFKGSLVIKTGIEADYFEGYEQQVNAIIDAYPYDYVIGSVHCIDGWMFDNPMERNKWTEKNVNEVYKGYYETLRKCARTGLFDIIGHVDLVKKFGHRPDCDIGDEIEKTAKVFKEQKVVIEINTSGLRKPVEEIYPSLSVLKVYCKWGVPITFGSDSHKPSEVAMDFDKAVNLAKEAGYGEYVLFRKRVIENAVVL